MDRYLSHPGRGLAADGLEHAQRELAQRDAGDDAQQHPHRQVALEDAHGLWRMRRSQGLTDGTHRAALISCRWTWKRFMGEFFQQEVQAREGSLASFTSQMPPWQQCSVR